MPQILNNYVSHLLLSHIPSSIVILSINGSDKEEVDSVIENRGSKKNDDSGSKDKNEEVIDECL
ncbi:hypothetical protein Tco_0568105, partial [Tanacetum coccineum]